MEGNKIERVSKVIRKALATLMILIMAVTVMPVHGQCQVKVVVKGAAKSDEKNAGKSSEKSSGKSVKKSDEKSSAKGAGKDTYKLEVNKSKCVVVAYKKEGNKWKYVRTMLCSPGSIGPTPNGTFRLGGKQRWGLLMGPVYGQYCTNITGSILFHSVWYHSMSKSSQSIADFNKLGRPASHGCVRLSTIDSKWIYDNCKSGTKVKIGYKLKVPKGKPKKIRSGSGWDPTDPDPANPHNKLKKAIIKAKDRTLAFGKTYKIKQFVKASNPNALEDITNRVKARVLINGKWKKASKIPTDKYGKVKVKFDVSYGYCKGNSKIVAYDIADAGRPSIEAENRTVKVGEKNAVKGVSATMENGKSVAKGMTVTIKDPKGKKVAKSISYKMAEKFVFDTEGKYKVTLVAVNPNFNDKTKKKTVTITVVDESKGQETQPTNSQNDDQSSKQNNEPNADRNSNQNNEPDNDQNSKQNNDPNTNQSSKQNKEDSSKQEQ